MSADNGIYLLKTPKDGGEACDYRVIHAQDIDSIYWNEKTSDYGLNVNPKILMDYFGDAPCLSEEEARNKASEMADEIMNDDYCPYLEYGIQIIELDHSFSWYAKKAIEPKK